MSASMHQMLHATGNVSRPEYYAGYGPNEGYVGTDRHLGPIYDQVLKERGDAAAKAYAQTLLDLKVWSPSNLIRALLEIDANNYQYRKPYEPDGPADDIAALTKREDGSHDVSSPGAFAGLFAAMDAPDAATQEFLSYPMKLKFLKRIQRDDLSLEEPAPRKTAGAFGYVCEDW